MGYIWYIRKSPNYSYFMYQIYLYCAVGRRPRENIFLLFLTSWYWRRWKLSVEPFRALKDSGESCSHTKCATLAHLPSLPPLPHLLHFLYFAHLLVASCNSSHSIKCAIVKPQLPHLTIRLLVPRNLPYFPKKWICIVCLNTFHLGVSNAK